MAWPKKGTRTIVVDDEPYLWHYNAHCPWCSDDVYTAGRAGDPYVLFIDPFPWVAEMGPKYVAQAIHWAVSQGWSTTQGPTKALSLDSATEQFFWLKEGQRHAACVGEAPDDV
jgi:hypothetical protein